jgi:hypothetical protein
MPVGLNRVAQTRILGIDETKAADADTGGRV